MINKAHRVGAAPAQSLEWGWPLTSRRTVSPSLCHLPNFRISNLNLLAPTYSGVISPFGKAINRYGVVVGVDPPWQVPFEVPHQLPLKAQSRVTCAIEVFLPTLHPRLFCQTKTRFLETFHIFLLEAFHIIEANHYKKHMLCLKCLWLMAQKSDSFQSLLDKYLYPISEALSQGIQFVISFRRWQQQPCGRRVERQPGWMKEMPEDPKSLHCCHWHFISERNACCIFIIEISGLVSLKILARPLTEIQIFKYQPPPPPPYRW